MEMREEILGAVDLLPEREGAIIRLRFGLDNDDPKTLDEVGQHFGLTRERIRQIEKKAKEKLGESLRGIGFAPSAWGDPEAESA